MSRLPVTAAPGAATVSTVRRGRGPARQTPCADPKRQERRHQRHADHEVLARLDDGCCVGETAFVDEICWCERNCAGYWSIRYAPSRTGAGRLGYFTFTRPDDAEAFRRWLEARAETTRDPRTAAS